MEPAFLPAPDQAMDPAKPAVEKIDASRYRIGKVIFDQKPREIRFPAKFNMIDGLLEFLVVHENAETHESPFVTDIIAIFLARSAMINYSGDDSGEDDVWLPFPKRIPAAGSEVTLILSLFQSVKLHRNHETDLSAAR